MQLREQLYSERDQLQEARANADRLMQEVRHFENEKQLARKETQVQSWNSAPQQ